MDIISYIEPELFIIVPVLYILGLMIKKSSINDKWIPIILGAMGIILATVYKLAAHIPCGFSEVLQIIFAGITQGILCASGSVYANNIVKQFKKGNGEDERVTENDIKDDIDLR